MRDPDSAPPDASAPTAESDTGDGSSGEARTSDLLEQALARFDTEDVPLGALVDALAERAFGLVLLVLALPCAIPFLYGVPQIVSLPMVFVAAQLAAGRHTLWLPGALRRRTLKRASLLDMLARARPWLRRFERVSRPRLIGLTTRPAEQVLGLLLMLFSLTILVPLPATNTVPGIAVAIVSLGFIERDGAMALVGTVLGIVWTFVLLSLAGGLVALISAAFNAVGA